MKRYHILIFILSAISALGVISHFFPQEGVKVGGLTFKFASLKDVLGTEEKEPEINTPSPEELLEMYNKAIADAQRETFERFFTTSPTRFYLPEDDYTFFDTVFTAFEKADSSKVRVVHYGDSQIEIDRVTHVIRDTLQNMFGGDGQGMMPGRKHYTFSSAAGTSDEGIRYMLFGNRYGGNKYGPYADFVRTSGPASLTYRQSSSKTAKVRRFNQVTVLAGNTTGNGLSISCGGSTVSFPAGEDYVRAVFSVPDSSVRTNVKLSAAADIYGVLLDNETGVAVDNAPMRGCSGTIFTQMNKGQLERFYKDENVKLILMQYGGNRVPSIKNSAQISKYCTTLRKQIRLVQSLAPDARLVFIGPSDMGRPGTYPAIPELVDSLRSMATSEGAAYWDIFGAMGGKNSMATWVNARPALAGSDHIHFTTRGAEKTGEMMMQSFKLYYEYYLWRKEFEE
ncbi:MAG: hypothetical protein IJ307_03860 [Bacteroidales bacterium]|nr:hypothetical protein [Bacteroidales bacterium]